MSEMVYVQPVFCPSRGQTDLNLNSLISLAEYIKSQEQGSFLRFDVVLGGWCINDQYWQEIADVCDKHFPADWNISLKKFDKNYGKAFVVNYLMNKYLPEHPETKYIMTCDSDMVMLQDQRYLFQRGILACQVASQVRKQKTGLVAFNQAEDNCHWVQHMDMRAPYKINELGIDEMLSWPSSKCGIAGGAWIISRDAWDAVGGYNVGNQAYHGDDGLLLRSVQEAGFTANVLFSCSIKHPKQEDKEYIEWKKMAMKEVWDSYDQKKRDSNIEASETFWKSRVN